MTLMHEDVEVTGFFFKRGAYRGKDANYTAPLILVNNLTWVPVQGQQDTTARGREVWRESVIVAVGLFAVGAVLTYLMVRGKGTSRRRLDGEGVRSAAVDLGKADIPPTLQESLKRLAEEADDEK